MKHEKIKTLSEREQCRQKVAIWFGSNDNFIHPFKEILANSIDEIYNNFDSGTIDIQLDLNKEIITISDTGRGIPLAGMTDGIENYKLLLLKLFAGTNYDNKQNDKVTTGTNGVGLTVTNYCSKYFRIRSYYGGFEHEITFTDGATNNYELISTPIDGNLHGTKICFMLDEEVFTNIKYNVEEIEDICNKLAGVLSSLNTKITINFSCGEIMKTFTYNDFHEYFSSNYISDGGTIIGNKSDLDDADMKSIQCILANSSDKNKHDTFLNMTYLKEGGTIVRGLLTGIKDYLNKYFSDEDKRIKKKKDELTIQDVEGGVSFVCNVLANNPEYSNQTKLSTNKQVYVKLARKYIMNVLEVNKNEHNEVFKKFANYIWEIKKHNDKMSAAHDVFKKKLSNKNDVFANLVDGLVDCKVHGEGSELFIVEGQSALGSIVAARNPHNQAAIAIRGKILNCLKSNLTDILKNDTIVNIIKTLGCGIDAKKNKFDNFDMSKLRYEKIILTCDADPDGEQITCLLMTLFYTLMPELLIQERIYIALTPLYEVYDSKTKTYHYAYTEEQKDEIIGKLDKYILHRNKGLGEVDAEVMAKTGVNPDTRNILKVKYSTAEQVAEAFNVWLGNDASKRKDYILKELKA